MNGARKSQMLAIVSLLLGILSVTCLCPLAGIPAIITGIIAYRRAHKLPDQFGGAAFAIAGLVMGSLALCLSSLEIIT